MSLLNLFIRRVRPSSPPPVYCAKCGFVVNLAGWDCPRCGERLHAEGATTTVPPSIPGLPPPGTIEEPPSPKPVVSRATLAGSVALVLVLLISLIPHKPAVSDSGPSYPLHGITAAFNGDHAMFLWMVFLVGVPVLLWVFGVFDR